MKATIVLAALTLALTATAQPQNDRDDIRPERPEPQRQFRGPGGPQFRGGDQQLDDRSDDTRAPRRGAAKGRNALQPGRGPGVCPNCGAPVSNGQGQGQGYRQGQGQGYRQGQGQGQGYRQGRQDGPGMGAPGRGQGFGYGPRSEGQNLPPGPPPAQFGRGGHQNPQGQPGFGPRGRGFGRSVGEDADDLPLGPRGAGRGGQNQ